MNNINIIKQNSTISSYLDRWVQQCPERVWLRDCHGDTFTEWSWRQAHDELLAVAAWLESEYGNDSTNFGLLSGNRAHWMLADMAIIASGNVTVPLFTTLPTDTADYILGFTDVKVLFLGEAENWDRISAVVPEHVQLVALPGVEPSQAHIRWQDIVKNNAGCIPRHRCQHDDLLTIVFTSGTTGVPKGVLQTHDSMFIPMERCKEAFATREQHPRFLSYLPLAHLAERQLVWIQSLIYCGEIYFNESLPTLVRDMTAARPTYFFGAPRVWEQLQQGILAQFGSQQALDHALNGNAEMVGTKVRSMLGLNDADYLLTASAPTPAALIDWYQRLGMELMEGYGQTEAMGLIGNTPDQRRIGSIGVVIEGIEVKITETGELCCKGDGLSPGYYKMPEKTAETFVDGWVHTGDKARVDEDGFYYITGRVKDYFKTIQGKFVAPTPIESAFAKTHRVEQLCLLGRGYSKTVMVCVLSEISQQKGRDMLEQDLRVLVEEVNGTLEHHARIGALMISTELWSIENGMLTPTLKIRREQVEERFGERAQVLARMSAEQGEVLVEWVV